MRVLLDTCAFLWWVLSQHSELSPRAIEIISDRANTVFFSAASAWEIAIKPGLGKITLPKPADRFIEQQLFVNGFTELPVTTQHALHTMALPRHADQKDPVDRILIAQSDVEDLPVLTNDPLFSRYAVRVIW